MGVSPGTYEKWRQSALQSTGEPIVTVSVGGSTKGKPMPARKWTSLRASVHASLANTVGPVSFATLGQSTWHGVSERSYVASVLSPDLNRLDALRARLRQLADAYGQDAVALTVGHSSLLGPGGDS